MWPLVLLTRSEKRERLSWVSFHPWLRGFLSQVLLMRECRRAFLALVFSCLAFLPGVRALLPRFLPNFFSGCLAPRACAVRVA
jgi:hypothetical protein